MSRLIKDNILSAGDYYPPGVYARLLSWYHDLEVKPDEMGPEFIPLTAVRPNPKMFVVGVLPPAQVISGRLLDRSASVRNLDPHTDIGQLGGGGAAAAIPNYGGGSSAGERIAGIALSMDGVNSADDPDRYSEFLMSQGDRDADAANGNNYWKNYYSTPVNRTDTKTPLPPSSCGIFALACLRAAGMSDEIIDRNYVVSAGIRQNKELAIKYDAWVEGSSPTLPDIGDLVLTKPPKFNWHYEVMTQKPAVGQETSTTSGGQRDPARKSMGVKAYGSTWRRNGDRWEMQKLGTWRYVDGWVDVSKLPIPGSAPQPPAFQPEGSEAAKTAQKQNDKLGNTGLNSTDIGVALLQAQADLAKKARAAMEAMANTPPLRLLVNPRQFDVKGTKIVQDGNWGRNGHIIEHWGDEQDKVSASGRVAGFYAVDAFGNGGPGLTRTARNYSAAWQNLQSLYMLYRNNGAMYLPDYYNREEHHNLALMGSIYIYYDSILYIGSFDTFTITEEDAAPHTVEYSWEFSVRAAFLLDVIPGEIGANEPGSYGAGSLFRSSSGIPTSSATKKTDTPARVPPPTSPYNFYSPNGDEIYVDPDTVTTSPYDFYSDDEE